MPHLAVIAQERDDIENGSYFLRHLTRCWLADGWKIQVVRRLAQCGDADLALLHVDLTHIPQAAMEIAARYPRVLNLRTLDIAKRRISRHLLTRDSDHCGPVIAKTDDNCGGFPEARLRHPAGLLGRLRHAWHGRRSPEARLLRQAVRYPVFDSLAAVPQAYWEHPGVVLEAFLPERHGGWYATRSWTFLGRQSIHRIAYAREHVVKSGNAVASEELGEIPPELGLARAELGFDYGKFDYVMVEGQAVLLDANRTPTAGKHLGDRARGYAERLAGGLYDYLAGGVSSA